MAAAEFSSWIHHDVYNAALTPGTEIYHSQLEAALSSVSRGGQSNLLHLAASAVNLDLVQQILKLKPLLVKDMNGQGNTALHLAAQGGYSEVVHTLLQSKECAVYVCNNKNETPLFKAYETGNLATVDVLFRAYETGNLATVDVLFKAKRNEEISLSLRQKTKDERSCLYVAVNRGDSSLADHILGLQIAEQLIEEKYKNGDSILHIAVGRNDVDLIKKLLNIEQKLCYRVNYNGETPLCVAAKLGHLEAVQELIKLGPDAVEIPNSCGMNVLHFAAQVSQVRIVDYLNEVVNLLELINNGVEKNPPEETAIQSGGEKKDVSSDINEGDTPLLVNRGVEKKPPQETPTQSGGETDRAEKKDVSADINEGDTPLHIAARNKCFNMVNSLLSIKGINKLAVNKDGLTALDIVRENTQYHESDKIISVLANYPPTRKPFMYSSPKVSAEKHEAAAKMVDKTFEERRNAELVVAVLLATMSFTAAFTIPGSFVTEVDNKVEPGHNSGSPAPTPNHQEFDKNLGSPILLGLDSFKLFLIFDCVAFFLSLFVVLLWQMSTPITTGNKILFLCATNLLVCATFAFTAYGFMAAVYAMLDRRANKLAWFILGACLIICGCGNLSFFYMAAKFSVKKARFNHLNGVLPFLTERVGEWVWTKLERWGLLDLLRRSRDRWRTIFYCRDYTDQRP